MNRAHIRVFDTGYTQLIVVPSDDVVHLPDSARNHPLQRVRCPDYRSGAPDSCDKGSKCHLLHIESDRKTWECYDVHVNFRCHSGIGCPYPRAVTAVVAEDEESYTTCVVEAGCAIQTRGLKNGCTRLCFLYSGFCLNAGDCPNIHGAHIESGDDASKPKLEVVRAMKDALVPSPAPLPVACTSSCHGLGSDFRHNPYFNVLTEVGRT